ncbi:DinB family protein [Yaniella flava]|uniref:DinB family protein n=1 Tax=Yaniella flava TaxID=287930 RepID=A0ABN2ULY3_9MICC
MDAIDILEDLVQRPMQALDYFWDELDPSQLNSHPGGHPNSIAWLLWHTARETDAQIAPLAGHDQLWTVENFDSRFGLSEVDLGMADVGLGQSPDDARGVTVEETQQGKDLLRDYLEAVYAKTASWIAMLSDDDLDRVIDNDWDPPVTVGVRIISVIDDAAQHIGQAAYVAGTVELHDLTS